MRSIGQFGTHLEVEPLGICCQNGCEQERKKESKMTPRFGA